MFSSNEVNCWFGCDTTDVNGNADVPPFSFSFVDGSINIQNSPVTDLVLTQNTIAETNAAVANDLLFGDLDAVDLDTVDTFFYDLVTGTGDADNARFRIVDDKIYLKQGEVLDYETKPSYSVRVRATTLRL